jgi:hypothetical protein
MDVEQPLVARSRRFALALCAVLALSGCGQSEETAKSQRAGTTVAVAKQPVVSQDVDKLAQVVQLPVRPAAAVWQVHSPGVNNPRTPGPTDYVVVAVLQYSPADAELVAANAAHGEAPIRARIEAADWFPAEVKALASDGAEGRA